jgi:hypothetical protein
MMVARRLAVLGDVNAGKASTLAMMGAELDRVRAAVWARFSGAKTAHLSKRQVRDQLMGENAPKEFGMPQRLWRATVEDTVDKIRAWQQAVIATELRPTIYARAGEQPCAFLLSSRAERDRARGRARNKLRAVRDRHLARAAAAPMQPVVGCERNILPPKRTTTVRGR